MNPPQRRNLRSIIVGVVAAAAIVAAGIVVAPRVLSSADGCTGSAQLRVAADPSIAEAVRSRAGDLMSGGDGDYSAAGTCTTVTVTDAGDAAGNQAIGDGSADLWIPRSLTWMSATVDPAAVENLGSVAVSPLVVVAPRNHASAMGWPEMQFSWGAVLSGETGTVLADPATTPEGQAALVAAQTVAGAAEVDQTELARVLTRVARSATGSVGDALTMSTTAQAPLFTTASEQAVIRFNQTGEASVVALYPDEGTFAFDYPALLSTSSDIPRSVVEAFIDDLIAGDGADAIREVGLRTPDGTAADDAGLVDGTSPMMPTIMSTPDPQVRADVMRQWSALAIDMRMLSVIDVSGSMGETVGDSGATRIELTRDAAKAALGLLPSSSSVGMWAFSIEQDPPEDHVELVSVGPLEQHVDDVTRLEALAAAADSLPDRAEGGTGLYDTALAAFEHMQANYEADKINSVVLLTDGRNEDDPDGISLETLLDTLRSQFDPENPIPIITIGISDDADMEALQQISEATGTKAYRAQDPRDIEQVFFDAMVERQCRPNC